MTIDRAIEILDPEHREQYETMDEVNEACYMAMKALRKQKPKEPRINLWDKWIECPTCGEVLSDEEGLPLGDNIEICHCFCCGQAIDWRGNKNAID